MATESSVSRAVTAMTEGRSVIVLGDVKGHVEGHLVVAAQKATTSGIAFMIRHTSGFICVAVDDERCDRLQLPPQQSRNDRQGAPDYRVAVDLKGVGTGISAEDRARTIAALGSAEAQTEHFTRPGHVIPVCASDGGVLQHVGYPEAAIDLARLANLHPAAAIAALVSSERPSDMAGHDEVLHFADTHGLPVVTLAGLVAHRRRTEPVLERMASDALTVSGRRLDVVEYRGRYDSMVHSAVLAHDQSPDGEGPVYVHTACGTADLLGSRLCGCRTRWDRAIAAIAETGRGMAIYVRPPTGTPRYGACGSSEDILIDYTWTVTSSMIRDLGFHPTVTNWSARLHESAAPHSNYP
ncbi:3,4-dihydroxy-2-butanone-4-phosphate synthase [Rhodococcus ruber]|uniref:3,4-dihydroxy-2-butanone-4-phosphate synthase n=1 Tax=Rhodococcus ruber TaxID=1830 RepID=UPI00265F33A6|nr:3,4-dihydroxy-2-butanone-4-phosphate synthase [Rhodococcus ruber]